MSNKEWEVRYSPNGPDDQDVELVEVNRMKLDDSWMDSLIGAEVIF